MNAIIVSPEGTRQVDVAPHDEYGDLDIPINMKRTVLLGRNVDQEPGENQYVAFWILGPEADKDHEYDKVFGGMSRQERVFAAIMHGVDIEPELPTEVVNLDGVSIIRIDLEKQLPGHVVLFPERHVP